jgi:hypothetical protein
MDNYPKNRCFLCGTIDFLNEDGLCPICEESTIYNADLMGDEDYAN